MDTIEDARSFLSAARIAARSKPVIIMKSAGTPYGALLRTNAPESKCEGMLQSRLTILLISCVYM